ncbi:MAG: ABC transporter permease, partial [Ruminococcus sp.]|nr:ABC transporter permease [Ruminococcus sp.]
MWKIFQEEFYKIASRKIIWIGLFCLLAFVRYRLWMVQDEYAMTIGGETIYGKEAIEKDQELTAKYAGPLTEEKVRDIYEQYGFYYLNRDTGEQRGNFCSRFITERMTNSMQLEEPALEEIQFYQGTDWENNAAPLLRGDLRFDYVYGWDYLAETYGILMTYGLAVIFIIGLSSVFSEEYSLRTADILLTTRRGKGGGIWMKTAAAFGFALAVFLASTIYVWAIYLKVFGTQGLSASSAMIGWGNRWGYCPDTVAGFLLYQFCLGFAGTV